MIGFWNPKHIVLVFSAHTQKNHPPISPIYELHFQSFFFVVLDRIKQVSFHFDKNIPSCIKSTPTLPPMPTNKKKESTRHKLTAIFLHWTFKHLNLLAKTSFSTSKRSNNFERVGKKRSSQNANIKNDQQTWIMCLYSIQWKISFGSHIKIQHFSSHCPFEFWTLLYSCRAHISVSPNFFTLFQRLTTDHRIHTTYKV